VTQQVEYKNRTISLTQEIEYKNRAISVTLTTGRVQE